jgi:hypothetical protein
MHPTDQSINPCKLVAQEAAIAGPEKVAEIEQIDQMDDLEFERRTLAAIRHELGLGGLARFLMTFRSGAGDYTRDRHQWLGNLTIEDIERELSAKTGA